MTKDSIGALLARAKPGPVLRAELHPLNNAGILRVSYNWLYSALNCEPKNTKAFGWAIDKLDEDDLYSLSPQVKYNNMTLYASVRPDKDYRVQVQAPGSGHWITRVQADEKIKLFWNRDGFPIVSMMGRNGKYLAVDPTQTSHQNLSGYLIHSRATSTTDAAKFYATITEILQPGLELSRIRSPDPVALAAELAREGAPDPEALARTILSSE